MAIKKYTNKLGTFYHASTYLGRDELTGKEIRPHKRGFKTKVEAQRWLDSIRVNGIEKTVDLTYKEVYEEWLETYRLTVSSNTFVTNVGHFERHILPIFGHLKIAKIKKTLVQKTLNEWATQMVAFNIIYTLCKRIFTYAYKEEYLAKNPCDNVVKPKQQVKQKEKVKFLEVHELKSLLETAKNDHREWLYPLLRLAAYTGMRLGEILPLEWKDLDLKNKTVSINKSITKNYDDKYVIGSTKTKKSTATLSLDDGTVEILKQWQVIQSKKYRLSHHIFVYPKNNALFYHQDINDILRNLCKKADIPIITMHALRHTHCSLLIQSGVNIKEVQARMRHTDIKTTLNVYAHVKKDDGEASQAFSKFVALS